MTADRDALAALIEEFYDYGGRELSSDVADAIIAAGWTPPPRQRDCDTDGHDWMPPQGDSGLFACHECHATTSWRALKGLD